MWAYSRSIRAFKKENRIRVWSEQAKRKILGDAVHALTRDDRASPGPCGKLSGNWGENR